MEKFYIMPAMMRQKPDDGSREWGQKIQLKASIVKNNPAIIPKVDRATSLNDRRDSVKINHRRAILLKNSVDPGNIRYGKNPKMKISPNPVGMVIRKYRETNSASRMTISETV